MKECYFNKRINKVSVTVRIKKNGQNVVFTS